MATAKEATVAPSAVGGKPITRSATDPLSPPVYFSVKLKKTIEHLGQIYRPGVIHVVDDTTMQAFGDNILEREPKATESFYIRKAS